MSLKDDIDKRSKDFAKRIYMDVCERVKKDGFIAAGFIQTYAEEIEEYALSRIEAALSASERTVGEKEWVDRLYDVRMEPDKLMIMIMNRRAQLKQSAIALEDGPLREGWISITDRLPQSPEYDWVLVQTVMNPEGWYGVPHVAELINGVWHGQGMDEPMEECLSIIVTHWMPLPAFPAANPEMQRRIKEEGK